MRLYQLKTNYLYEGLTKEATNTMFLWENAGHSLKEAALTPDQISKIFADVEAGVSSGGGNRTLLGKGKDAASAVNTAWEDLKTKVQNSAPIANVDKSYDSVVAKIEAGLGGSDNAVNQVIQKYRKFAKEHPIAQGFIYSALIAAAGISGAGLGGAAVLGLLKMADKLLQGEKFSSAAYSGAKTGAMAYGASKIGDMIKGKPEATPSAGGDSDYVSQMRARGIDPNDPDGTLRLGMRGPNNAPDAVPSSFKTDFEKLDKASLGQSMKMDPMLAQRAGMPGIPNADAVAGAADKLTASQMSAIEKAVASGEKLSPALQASVDATTTAADVATSQPYGAGMSSDYLQKVVDAGGKSGVRFKISPEDAQKALDWQAQNSGLAVDAATSAGKTVGGYSADYLQQVINGTHPRPMINKDRAAELLKAMKGESLVRQHKSLSEGQVYMIFNRICSVNDGIIAEGPMDFIKGAAAKGMQKLQTFGKNLTTKITADKLNSAWQKAGSPMDSEELKQFLVGQGVDASIIDSVYSGLKLTPETPAASGFDELQAQIMKLDKKNRQRIIAYLQKQLGNA